MPLQGDNDSDGDDMGGDSDNDEDGKQQEDQEHDLKSDWCVSAALHCIVVYDVPLLKFRIRCPLTSN